MVAASPVTETQSSVAPASEIPPDVEATLLQLAVRFVRYTADRSKEPELGKLYHALRAHYLRGGVLADEAYAITTAQNIRAQIYREENKVRRDAEGNLVGSGTHVRMVSLQEPIRGPFCDVELGDVLPAPEPEPPCPLPPEGIGSLLEKLPVAQRAAVDAVVLRGLGRPAAAAYLGLSAQEIARALHAGLAALRDHVARDWPEIPGLEAAPPHHLPPKLLTVVRLIAAGRSQREIADTMGLSLKTVYSHIARIYDRLGTRNHVGIVRFALAHGLMPSAAASE